MDKSPADVLEEAADLLLLRGRARGDGMDRQGRLCVLGAVMAAVDGEPNEWVCISDEGMDDHGPIWRTVRESVAALGAAVSHPYGWEPADDAVVRVYEWNDCLRSDDDDFTIIDTLRHVAKDLRNEAAQ